MGRGLAEEARNNIIKTVNMIFDTEDVSATQIHRDLDPETRILIFSSPRKNPPTGQTEEQIRINALRGFSNDDLLSEIKRRMV